MNGVVNGLALTCRWLMMGLVLACVDVEVTEGIGWTARLELATSCRRLVKTEGEDEQEGERTRAAIGLKFRWK